jgi:metal-responsive CopG/Arc/MetJ family transcriptional regulator
MINLLLSLIEIMPENNLQIDENLLQEAITLGNCQSHSAVIEAALYEYIQRRKQLKIVELFGTIDYELDYDYKQQRQQA